MATSNDINKQVRYVVGGVVVAEGRLVGIKRDGWATIRETKPCGGRREDDYPPDFVELAK